MVCSLQDVSRVDQEGGHLIKKKPPKPSSQAIDYLHSMYHFGVGLDGAPESQPHNEGESRLGGVQEGHLITFGPGWGSLASLMAFEMKDEGD